jgi:hypothetical protein
MRSKRSFTIAALLVPILALIVGTSLGVYARGNQPPTDATPGAVGFQGAILAAIDTSVAPGYQLQLAQSVFQPGAFVTSHIHPTAIVVCVQSGALGFALQHGAGTITRGAEAGADPVTEALLPGNDIVLEPRDCVSFDHFAQHTSHTGWNASDGETVLVEARLVKTGEPFTTFIDAQGTPVSS